MDGPSASENEGRKIMIKKTNAELIDEVIEYFEDHWSPASRRRIRVMLEQFGLQDDPEAATELIRIDIERRYSEGLSNRLSDYFDEFESLLLDPRRVSEVAFEDYRSRTVFGHPVSPSRWRDLPGVENQGWFRQLVVDKKETKSCSELTFAKTKQSLEQSDLVDAEILAAIREIGFEVHEIIGKGTFSQVYLATQNDLADRYVVLKIVRDALSEPQKLALLQHTNIVPIYSFHRIKSRSVICMPYAGGVTLDEFFKTQGHPQSRSGHSLVQTLGSHRDDSRSDSKVRSTDSASQEILVGPAADVTVGLRPLDQIKTLSCHRLAVWMFQRLAAGLAHSHARGVLHGDLKPANVLIRNDGEPAILDFNLAQSLTATRQKQIGGTLPYMPPETYQGFIGSEVITHAASDLYSLGVMMYEFLTGRLPYPAPRTAADIDLAVAVAERRQRVTWEPQDVVPTSLRCIVERCLEFDPSDRYQTAQCLQEDLQSESNQQTLRHTSEPLSSQSVKWFRRHPRLIGGTAIALLLFGVIIPMAVTASASQTEARLIKAKLQFDLFAKQSDETLSETIVDPLRNTEEKAQESMAPLKEHGILKLDVKERLIDLPGLSLEVQMHRRDVMLRHITHVAIAEIDRIEHRFGDKIPPLDQLVRIDQLLAAVNRLNEFRDSRSANFLAASRAKLVGDEALYQDLLQIAESTPLQSDNETYLEAIRKLKRFQYREAVDLLKALADRQSIPSTLRWAMLGRSQIAAGDLEDAKLSLTQAIERIPNSPRLWYLRGQCYYQLRRMKRANEDYTEAVDRDPKFVAARWARAQTLLSMGRPEEAVNDLDEGVRISPNNAGLLMRRSDTLREQGREEESLRDYRQAINIKINSPLALYERAVFRGKRDPEGALVDLDSASLLQPKSPRIQHERAVLFTQLGRIDEAIVSLEQVEKLQQDSEKATADRAVLLAREGRYEEASLAVELAMETPNASSTIYQAACACALMPSQPKRIRALSLLAKALRSGYGAPAIRNDPDLDGIRNMPGFRAILRTVMLSGLRAPATRVPPSDRLVPQNIDSPTNTSTENQ